MAPGPPPPPETISFHGWARLNDSWHRYNVGAFIIRIGFWGSLIVISYNIPPDLILIIKAPILGLSGLGVFGLGKWFVATEFGGLARLAV